MKLGIALVCLVLAAGTPAAAQTQSLPDECAGTLNPYTSGNPQLAQRCADRGHSQTPPWSPSVCIRPYSDSETWLCPPGAPQTMKSLAIEDSHYRFAIVQASIGAPGRERPYVVLLNLTDAAQQVAVEYMIDGRIGTFVSTRTLQPKERLPIGLHMDQVFVGASYFSVVAAFERAGLMEMAWHRASDHAEVATKTGTLVP